MIPFLAEASPVAQLTDNNLAVGVMILVGGVAVIGNLVSIYVQLRRTPPIEVDMNKLKEEVRDEVAADLIGLRAELNGRLAGLSEKIESRVRELKTDVSAWIRESMMAGENRVARLENHLAAGLEAAQADTKEILRAIGALDAGKVDKK